MDDIAPEYDVVVLGTGLLYSIPQVFSFGADLFTCRLNRVRLVWVCNIRIISFRPVIDAEHAQCSERQRQEGFAY